MAILNANPNSQTKQAVLGATGDIGNLLVQELRRQDIPVRALSRVTPKVAAQRQDVEYGAVDAEKAGDLMDATKGMDVVYATLSVPYGAESWQRSWPPIMRNIIDAAKENKFKFVFLDNVYMYGQVDGAMTEETPYNPSSKKGEVRAEIADMLTSAMAGGDVIATIGRSADFYGPGTRISSCFFEGTYNEGVAYWMGKTTTLRTLSYTLDNARALAVLGNDERADRQVWHMPAAPAMTGAELIALAGKILGKDLRMQEVPGSDPEVQKAFAQNAPELVEMMYQYNENYIFDSTKFQTTFGVSPTSYEDGFRHIYDHLSRT